MVSEDREILSGWPLGLEIMNSRLQIMAQPERLPERFPSMSCSSLSSSELDTVSTASFFQDHSVSLGRLIGIRPTEKRRLQLLSRASSAQIYDSESIAVNAASSKENKAEISRRICVRYLCFLAAS